MSKRNPDCKQADCENGYVKDLVKIIKPCPDCMFYPEKSPSDERKRTIENALVENAEFDNWEHEQWLMDRGCGDE